MRFALRVWEWLPKFLTTTRLSAFWACATMREISRWSWGMFSRSLLPPELFDVLLQFFHAEGLGQQGDMGMRLDEVQGGLVGPASGKQDGHGGAQGAKTWQGSGLLPVYRTPTQGGGQVVLPLGKPSRARDRASGAF